MSTQTGNHKDREQDESSISIAELVSLLVWIIFSFVVVTVLISTYVEWDLDWLMWAILLPTWVLAGLWVWRRPLGSTPFYTFFGAVLGFLLFCGIAVGLGILWISLSVEERSGWEELLIVLFAVIGAILGVLVGSITGFLVGRSKRKSSNTEAPSL